MISQLMVMKLMSVFFILGKSSHRGLEVDVRSADRKVPGSSPVGRDVEPLGKTLYMQFPHHTQV